MEEQKNHKPDTNQNERGYDPRDKFTLHPDAIEWLTDEEAKAYEKWLDNTPEVSSTEGVAPEYMLGNNEAENKESKKPSKARKKKTT